MPKWGARLKDHNRITRCYWEGCHAAIPENIPQKVLSRDRVLLSRVLTDLHLATSRTDARRLIQQGAVSIDGERIVSETELLAPKEFMLKIGKRRYVKVSLR